MATKSKVSPDAERAEVDAAMTAHWQRRAELEAEWDALRDRKEAVIKRQLEAVTDEQIMSDDDLRRQLCRDAFANTAAYHRKNELVAARYGDLIRVEGYDGREEYQRDVLPMPRIEFQRGADVTATEAALRDFYTAWGLGRESLIVGIMESTLSEFGVFQVWFQPGAEVEAKLTKTTYGRERDVTAGSLAEVLAYVAQNHPYASYSERYDEDDD